MKFIIKFELQELFGGTPLIIAVLSMPLKVMYYDFMGLPKAPPFDVSRFMFMMNSQFFVVFSSTLKALIYSPVQISFSSHVYLTVRFGYLMCMIEQFYIMQREENSDVESDQDSDEDTDEDSEDDYEDETAEAG